jgi:hypothetical protein
MTRFYALVFFLFCSLAAVGQGLPGYVVTLKVLEWTRVRASILQLSFRGGFNYWITYQASSALTQVKLK